MIFSSLFFGETDAMRVRYLIRYDNEKLTPAYKLTSRPITAVSVGKDSDVCLTQIYIHNVSCASRKVRVLRPFVTFGFVMMSLLCGVARYGLYYNHWTDVVVGFVVGVLLAVYIVSSSTVLTVRRTAVLINSPL